MIHDMVTANQAFLHGISQYPNDFLLSCWTSGISFYREETKKINPFFNSEDINDYLALFGLNYRIAEKGLVNNLCSMSDFHGRHLQKACSAWTHSIVPGNEENLKTYTAELARLMCAMAYDFPAAVRDIGSEYGLNVEEKGYQFISETDRFVLYQVLPRNGKIKVRKKGKPVIILPSHVIGAHILGFLPDEGKSYVHAFADQGIPTYIRIVKDIATTPAVQTMTGEDDTRDLRTFCEKISALHGSPVTINGYGQGGYTAALNLLSGELDDLVDALIACASPMDGSRSKAIVSCVDQLPERFRDLGYVVKTLSNGNQVVDGTIINWLHKLLSIGIDGPFFSFYRDLDMLESCLEGNGDIGKTALGTNYWLLYDRTDLPLSIARLILDSCTASVQNDGTLPVKLFGRALNFKRLKEKGVKVLICIAENDELVDKEAALAIRDHIEAEVSVFPNGHGSIAVSWSHPASDCALDTVFGDNYRGPVRFQLDLESELAEKKRPSREKKKSEAKAAVEVKDTSSPKKSTSPRNTKAGSKKSDSAQAKALLPKKAVKPVAKKSVSKPSTKPGSKKIASAQAKAPASKKSTTVSASTRNK